MLQNANEAKSEASSEASSEAIIVAKMQNVCQHVTCSKCFMVKVMYSKVIVSVINFVGGPVGGPYRFTAFRACKIIFNPSQVPSQNWSSLILTVGQSVAHSVAQCVAQIGL